MLGAWSVYLPAIAWPAALALGLNVLLVLVRVRAEERVLAAAFGDEYLDYRRRVPRFLPGPGHLPRLLLTARRRRRHRAISA
jgi:protein-S-isoprenylcysteine O-methyltransferase Ste14